MLENIKKEFQEVTWKINRICRKYNVDIIFKSDGRIEIKPKVIEG